MNARPARSPADVDAVAHVFVDALDDRCVIAGEDGHHLQRVRRLAVGETITAADGSGAWRTYAVTEVSNGTLGLVARDAVQGAAGPATPSVTLAVALTKGGLDDVVAAATELGAARFIPVRTARVVVRWDEARAAKAVTRWRMVAREAAMQSRRTRVPVVDDVVDLSALVDRSGLLIAARDGVRPSDLAPAPREGWTVLVGPEGGLAGEELAALAHAPRLRLGPHVLRAGTAPVAAIAALGAELARVGPE